MIQFRTQVPPEPPPPYSLGFGIVDLLATAPGHPDEAPQADDGWRAFAALRHQLVFLVREGLRVADPAAWLAYWQTEQRLETFQDLFDGLRALSRQLDGNDRAEEVHQQKECHNQVVAAFPFLEEPVYFVEQTMARCLRVAHDLVRTPAPQHKRQEDDACATRFNFYSTWSLMSLNTLLVLAGDRRDAEPIKVDDDMLSMIAWCARSTVLAANHAVRNGQRLRRVEESSDVSAEMGCEEISDEDLADVEKSIRREEALH